MRKEWTQPMVGAWTVALALLVLPAVGASSAPAGTAGAQRGPGPLGIHPELKLVKTIGVQNQPGQPTLDPVNGHLYVPNYGSGTVSVLNGATNKLLRNVTVGLRPVHVVFDNATDQLYVLNLGSNSVSVLSGTTDKVVRTVNVSKGLEPIGTYDPANGDVYVLSAVAPPHGYVLSHINKTSYKVRAIGVGAASQIFYDPANLDLITPNTLTNNLSVVGPKATVAKTITLSSGVGPASLTYDPSSSEMYVIDSGISNSAPPTTTGNVTVLSRANAVVATITVGQLPVVGTIDPVHHTLFVVNQGFPRLGVLPNTTVSVIGPAHTVTKTLMLGVGGVLATYSPASQAMYVACSGVNKTFVINTTTNKVVAKLTTKGQGMGTFFDPTNSDILVVPYSSTGATVLTVVSSVNRVVTTITIGTGLPGPTYDALNGDLYIANLGSANVSVLR